MNPPKIIVIDDDPEVTNLFKESIPKISSQTGINFNLQTYPQCPENIKDIQDACLYFIDFFMPNLKGPDISRKLKEIGSTGTRILITGQDSFPDIEKEQGVPIMKRIFGGQEKRFYKWLDEEGKKKLFYGNMIKPLKKEDIEKIVLDLRQERELTNPISLGVIGLGKLGNSVVADSSEQSWVSHVYRFTNWVKGDYSQLAHIEIKRSKVTDCKSLEEVVEANPDVLLITTGEHDIPYHEYPSRNDLDKRLMEGSFAKIKPILQAIKNQNYQGLISIESNVNGPLLYIANKIGIPEYQLTSFPPDTIRHKEELLRRLANIRTKGKTDLTHDDVDLLVVGEHGREIPLLEKCTIRGRSLQKSYSKFRKIRYKQRFTNEARKIGLRVMRAAEKSKESYTGTPNSVTEILDDIAHLQASSRFPIYAHLPREDGFLSVPSRFTYPLSVQAQMYLEELTQDKKILKQLRKQIKYQRELAKPYISE